MLTHACVAMCASGGGAFYLGNSGAEVEAAACSCSKGGGRACECVSLLAFVVVFHSRVLVSFLTYLLTLRKG